MIVIADGGSTKIEWAFLSDEGEAAVQEGSELRLISSGVNPVLMSAEDIGAKLAGELEEKAHLCDKVTAVYYYGAGCAGDYAHAMEKALAEVFPKAVVNVASDMLGAARALFGRRAGIACILGTGSNSCVCEGGEIVKAVPPMGFILGDEGSGAALGKMLVNGVYKGWIGQEMRETFVRETGLSAADVIARVYRQEMPSKFLASLVEFVRNHENEEVINGLIVNNFRNFFKYNLEVYSRHDLPLGFVGGLASSFERQLRQVAAEFGYHFGGVMRRPIDGMIAYHQSMA